MKKKTIVILTVVALLIAGISAVVWWQFDNIKAVYLGLKYSSEDIESKLSRTDDDVKKFLESNPQYSVRPIEPLEEELYKEGMITDKELTDIITGETTVADVFGTQISLSEDKKLTITESGQLLNKETADRLKQETEASKENDTSQKDKDQDKNKVDNSAEISKNVAQLYVLKSSFVSRLDGLYNQAVADYRALTPEQKKNDGKTTIANRYYSSAASMEAECDAQVSAILTKIEKLLKEQGSDTALIDKIKASYYQEKSLKKAYYINKLK